MDILLFQLVVLLSFSLFLFPQKINYFVAFGIEIALSAITSYWAVLALSSENVLRLPFFKLLNNPISLEIDSLSAFFILVVNLTMLLGFIYAKGYLKPYLKSKSNTEFAFHIFNYLWLHISMILVCSFRDGLSFLIAWELMSLSSFFLVIFNSEIKDTIKTGVKYLIQMHIGMAFLLVAFLVMFVKTGESVNFDSLTLYFSQFPVFPLFLMFFIGFGIKAGFIPFHTWLPHAHPAAPSHVSGVMSGVMIKMGIYGILRVLTYIHTDLFYVGIFIFLVSLVSGLLGVIYAIVQHDIKKLLAYHSIENIGIIGMGIGLGVIGLSTNNMLLAVLGFAGGILHIFNHSLFKSLLFYTAGNVYKQTHTRNVEELGGLIKKMPKTACLFLFGAIAISGLPPFNGFISEFLIYTGMFKSLHSSSFLYVLVILLGIIGLTVIGGLALYCFTKVFSVMFLGNPRSSKTDKAVEVENIMLIPSYIITAIMLAIGIFPSVVVKSLSGIVDIFILDNSVLESVSTSMAGISWSVLIIFGLVLMMYFIRRLISSRKIINEGPTWGCGYTGANPATNQYTSTSYADYIGNLTHSVTGLKKEYKLIEKDEIFPEERSFKTTSHDVFEEKLILKPTNKLLAIMKKMAVFQTGNVQHYLLYALVFIIIISLLTFFKVI